MGERDRQRDRRRSHASPVDQPRGRRHTAERDGTRSKRDQYGGAEENDRQRHVAGLFSRTPRPPPWLIALSVMSSMPSASRAATSFISESTLPRMTPSLASMR